jgi:hypothetical protein
MLAQDGRQPWRDRYGAQAGFSFGRVKPKAFGAPRPPYAEIGLLNIPTYSQPNA